MNSNYLNSLQGIALEHWQWIAQLFAVLLMTWVASVMIQKMLRRFGLSADSSWHLALLTSALSPLRVFIWLGGISICITIIHEQFPLPIIKLLQGIQPVALIIMTGWFLLRFKRQAFQLLSKEAERPMIVTLDLANKIVTACIIVGMALMLLPSLGISINGILAFGGIGGVIVGLAAKDMLANVFGAVMIHVDHPFVVGDWISLPEKQIQGVVESIGWRQIIIRTFDTRQVFIPNSMVGTIILENPDRMTHRRIYETIGVRYDDIGKITEILADIRSLVENHPDIDKKTTFLVNLTSFSAYSVDFLVSAYTRKTNWGEFLQLKEALLLSISDVIIQHNAEIAFPTQVMQIKYSGNDNQAIAG